MKHVQRSSWRTGTATVGQWWQLVRRAGSAWLEDYAQSMGAALSYYTVFSLAPILLIVLAIAGLVFGQDAARGALFAQLSRMMGADAAHAVEAVLASASRPSGGTLAVTVGVVFLLVGATTVFGELQDSLDRIWRVPARQRSESIWNLLRSRFLSFGMILGIAFLLMVSLVVNMAVSAVGTVWGPALGNEVVAQAITFVFGLVITTIGFALIYKVMPRADVQWHDVWIGAGVTAVLFSLGRFLISFYIGKSGVASSYGAAGSLVIVFIWVYYSAQIFLLGAEFTWVYATSLGSMKDVAKVAGLTAIETPMRVGAQSEGSQARKPVPLLSDVQLTEKKTVREVPAQRLLAGITIAVLLRYVTPWLLRRLARR